MRDAAKAIDRIKNSGNANQAILLWIGDGGRYGMASYGRTRALCREAGVMGDFLFTMLGQYLSGIKSEAEVREELEKCLAEIRELKALEHHEVGDENG